MKIFNINSFLPNFKGIRQDRNTVEQLKKDNKYDLNVPNQRKISTAIENLSEVPGEANVNFLLDVSENLQYGTNIDLGKASFNDWQVKLNNAAQKALSKSSKDVQERLFPRLQSITSTPKTLTEDEKEILSLRNSILSKIDPEELSKIKSKNIKQLERNLDYFIVSSEVQLSQKLYIMKRLNHFMSDEYQIHPQLQDKKTQALAEIINDITVDTPESEIPNIKAVNQKSHGMCAAISICRKALAYEDKANFVDMVMSEIDNSDYMQVYDITKLGTNTKIPINKTNINYNYALERGYRIIDTSALNWMQIADTAGSVNEPVGMYSSFDKSFFDTFHDSHLTNDVDDPELVIEQDYYRALLKAKSEIGNIKKLKDKKQKQTVEQLQNNDKNLKSTQIHTKLLNKILTKISPELNSEKAHYIITELQKLEAKNSTQAQKVKDFKQNFIYLPNESQNAKLEKIKAFLSISLPERNSEELNKQAPEILKILDVLKETKPASFKNSKAAKINNAKMLYSAAATYRIQQLFALEIPENRDEMLRQFNIPDRETRISQNIDMLVNKLEKGTLRPEIRETLAKNFDTENDPEALIIALRTNQETLNYTMTELLDNFFESCLAQSRKNVLTQELTLFVDQIKNNNDKLLQTEMADILKIKDNKKAVVETLEKYIEILNSENCTEQQYINIYNKVGKKNQMMDFKETFERLANVLFEEKNPDVIKGFNVLHGLAPDAPIEETFNTFDKIGKQFNNISALITQFQQALEVKTPDGEILNTVDSKEIIMKKLENKLEIIPEKDLRSLQTKFTKIDKARSNVNGESITIKDLPEELTTFTPREKEVLQLANKNINGWYSAVSRSLNTQYHAMKEFLEEHHRQIGLKTGQNWIQSEGGSGLFSYQQVKIIEHMTDRPYYIETNTENAVKRLKELPYSGISSTSVDHRRPAMHAQYIVDIKPVQVKTEKGIETKEALFHDNTWGPSEHENMWHDENGLNRTDYSNNYGGTQGYITDEKYRNGNLLENLINQYGENQIDEINSYKYPMFQDVITPGKDPDSNSYVRQIRQNTLLHPAMYFEDMEKSAQTMTKAQIKAVINKTKSIGENIEKEYISVERRIMGEPPFSNGINTQKDYDNLPDSDPVKILFEKIALLRSYDNIPDSKIFYKKTSIEELRSIKKDIQTEARKNFNYTFGKNPDITKYAAESVRENVYGLLDEFAKENNIKISPTMKIDMINSLNKINKNEFDGSLETTIKLMSESFVKYSTKHLANFPDKNEKLQVLSDKIRSELRSNMSFTLTDLNNSSSGIQNIIKWIDNNFKPTTDEEFVQIFNNLQNLTTEEFEQKYNSTITDETLGIKTISGFDLIKRFRGYEERIQNSVYNMLFYEQFGYNIQMSKTIPSYEYNKLNKVIRGAYYSGKRTFDDLYLDYYYSLKLLSLDKAYNKIKDMAFRKYGLFPAYPKMNVESKEEVQKLIQTLYDEISDSIDAIDSFKVQEQTITLVNDLNKIAAKISNDSIPPTTKQRNLIIKKISEFLEVNGEDESIKESVDAAQILLTLDENASGNEYKELIKVIYDEISMYETTVDGKTMTDAAKNQIKEIRTAKDNFMMNVIDPKYQKKGYELLDKWISAAIKKRPEADEYFRDFEIFYDKYKMIRSPERMLGEYLLLLGQDPDKKLTEEQQNAIDEVKETYRTNLQALLFNANILEMQKILMDCASNANLNIVRDEFKNSKMLLNNGMIVDMDSDFAISAMLAPLIADSDLDTAVIFIEQLGLSEKVIDMLFRNAKFKEAYNNIRRIDNIFLSVSRQTGIVQRELKTLENLDNDPDYINRINTAKENIIRKFKNTNYRKTSKIIDAAFQQAFEEIEKNPQSSKIAYLHLFLNSAQTASIYVAKKDVENLNIQLQEFQRKINLMRRLKLPKYSPAEHQRQQYLEEVNKIEQFLQKHTRHYKNLDLSTGTQEI